MLTISLKQFHPLYCWHNLKLLCQKKYRLIGLEKVKLILLTNEVGIKPRRLDQAQIHVKHPTQRYQKLNLDSCEPLLPKPILKDND